MKDIRVTYDEENQTQIYIDGMLQTGDFLLTEQEIAVLKTKMQIAIFQYFLGDKLLLLPVPEDF